jgi:Flp pilus assembly protein TadD
MSTNYLKREPNTKIWISAVISTLIFVVLILGCFRKIIDDGNPYFVGQKEQNNTLSEKDLNRFGSSVKVIDGQAESHYKMALYFQRRKKHKLAIEELKKAVQLNPSFLKAYNAMGVSYDNLRRHSQAIRCYQSALKLDPKLDYVYNNLGYSYLLKNELDEAIVAFEKAIELNANNKRYQNNLGLAYVMKDQYDKAYEQFKIVEDETKAEIKLTRLLDQLGKEKPEQYLAKDTDLTNPPKTIKADVLAKRQKALKKEETQISSSNKKTDLSPYDKTSLDETQTSSMHSPGASTKNQQVGNSKKVKNLENIEKEGNREHKIGSKKSDAPADLKFSEENTANRSSQETMNTTSAQIIVAKNQKSDAKSTTQKYKVNESSASSNPAYDSSTTKLASEPASGKNLSTESIKIQRSNYKNSTDTENTFPLKVPKVEDTYHTDAQETGSATPGDPIEVKEDLIEPNQTIKSQQEEASILAVKETDLDKYIKPKKITFEVEIEVANGNGINGAAGRFGSYLKSNGFKVVKVTNANSFDHAITKIFFCNNGKKDVYELLRRIPFVLDEQAIVELKKQKNLIKIIIGKDLVKYDQIISSTIIKKRRLQNM